jgi:predicted amino acid dehydrogenase
MESLFTAHLGGADVADDEEHGVVGVAGDVEHGVAEFLGSFYADIFVVGLLSVAHDSQRNRTESRR